MMLYYQHPLLLTLTAPSAINSTWLQNAAARFGGVSGDAIGQGHFSVWQNGKGNTQGYCEVTISNTKAAVAATHGLKIISSARRITATQQNDLISIANIAAYDTLISAWQKHEKLAKGNHVDLPYHQLIAVHARKASLIESGDYMLSSIVIADADNRSVTLSKPLKAGDWLSWATRDTDAAQIDIVKTTNALKRQLAVDPAFGLLFSSLGRGPYFYNGQDLDLALIKILLPNMPLIGFYGNGEIAPINGVNTLLEYSAVLGLFGDENVS
jgi:small ligand-binding sensory domain FIST